MNNLFFIHLSLPSSSRLRPHVFASTNKIDPFYSDPDPSPAPGFWMAACPYTLTHTHTHTHTLRERERERESEWSSEEQNAAPSVRSSLRSWQTLQSLDTLHLSRLQPLCSGCNTTTNLPTDFILKIYFHSTFSVLFCFFVFFLPAAAQGFSHRLVVFLVFVALTGLGVISVFNVPVRSFWLSLSVYITCGMRSSLSARSWRKVCNRLWSLCEMIHSRKDWHHHNWLNLVFNLEEICLFL